ncbi:hypothetical protein CAC42_5928 [Sphaceloma murrayae]|uniref:Mitochondrial import inner membrane translocase subunit TIM50 n=1 Tax=Sphaceloma murrayae TaxID=2082308 RepID=A0A2K1QZK8_9PEZI|nr:hypothetical protein CAC42_5928 [Sphaceloma murrayae]
MRMRMRYGLRLVTTTFLPKPSAPRFFDANMPQITIDPTTGRTHTRFDDMEPDGGVSLVDQVANLSLDPRRQQSDGAQRAQIKSDKQHRIGFEVNRNRGLHETTATHPEPQEPTRPTHRYNLRPRKPASVSDAQTQLSGQPVLNPTASPFTAPLPKIGYVPPHLRGQATGSNTDVPAKSKRQRKPKNSKMAAGNAGIGATAIANQAPTTPKSDALTPNTKSLSKNWTPRGSSTRPPPLSLLPIPTPSPTYLSHCARAPFPSPPRRLLLILDLNGTLGHRSSPTNLRPRPHLSTFLDYAFREHEVMIWTSMVRSNVDKVLKKMLSEEQRGSLRGVWTREDLRLGREFAGYVQVYKRLGWVWGETQTEIEGEAGGSEDRGSLAVGAPGEWGVGNTVLVDDSWKKAVSEPYNHLVVKEWEGPGKGEGMQDAELLRVVDVLEELRRMDDVGRAMYAMRARDGVEDITNRIEGMRVEHTVGWAAINTPGPT